MSKQKIDRAELFNGIRRDVFREHMSQKQVDGINHILDVWESSEFEDLRWLAYMLGTAYHETAATMQPVHEYGNVAYFTRMYDIQGSRPELARALGNLSPGDGAKYAGRGYVQLTGKNNYARCGKLLGVDLIGNPDLAMDPVIAAKIMFEGMTRTDVIFVETPSVDGNFTFTGRALEDYFNDNVEDWIGARRIINGTDHAALIAETAQEFNDFLDYVDNEKPA